MAFPKLWQIHPVLLWEVDEGWRGQREQSAGCEGQQRSLSCCVGWVRLAEQERSSQTISTSTAPPSRCSLCNNAFLPKPSLCSFSVSPFHKNPGAAVHKEPWRLLWLPLTSPTSLCGCSRGSASPAAVCGGDARKRIIPECAVVRKIPSGVRPGRHLLWQWSFQTVFSTSYADKILLLHLHLVLARRTIKFQAA